MSLQHSLQNSSSGDAQVADIIFGQSTKKAANLISGRCRSSEPVSLLSAPGSPETVEAGSVLEPYLLSMNHISKERIQSWSNLANLSLWFLTHHSLNCSVANPLKKDWHFGFRRSRFVDFSWSADILTLKFSLPQESAHCWCWSCPPVHSGLETDMNDEIPSYITDFKEEQSKRFQWNSHMRYCFK